MAGQQSPVKRLRKTVNGHLCNISPIKDKQKPYFEAFLHHEGECCKVVAFKEEDYMNFQNAEKTQSPVTLQNVIVQPSKSNGRTNVYYTHTSKMSCVRDISHAFKNTLPDEPQDIKLSELPKLDINHLRININVKIILEEYKGHNVVWDGRYLPKTVYTVADTTGYVSLTVWGEESVTVGEWYKITNVSVKQFKEKKSLSTTKQTQILSIPSQGTTVDVEVPIKSVKCYIIGVNINSLFICHRKHQLKNIILSRPSVYCYSCKTHYKITAAIMKISGHLELKPETGDIIIKANAEDEVIRSALAMNANASQNDIIQGLLSLPLMQMTICNNVIVKMEESKCPLTESDQVMASLAVTDPADVYSPPDLRLFFSSQRQKRNLSIDSKPKRSKDHQSLVAIRAVHRIL
ncbi:uncharacterized protein [Misgurnus anguillicaudatus]|uniref:uncharacterized protein isoform X1 n=2 Tax=Misgurnus anguillicaudatus TaxID=75329 RepID=UPI003CCF3A10